MKRTLASRAEQLLAGSRQRRKLLAVATPQATVVVALVFLSLANISHAGWIEAAWTCRRNITVTWDAEHASGRELATVECYTDGRCKPDGSDLRIASEEGKLLPLKILQLGPGDRVRLLFPLQKNIKDYALYFGNPAAPIAAEDVPITSGLLMSMRVWNGQNAHDDASIRRCFDRSSPAIGQVMIPDLFLGFNPLSDQTQTVSKITGSVFAPVDGSYLFAISVDRFGSLSIDNQPLLFARTGPGDIRYHANMTLTRGPHEVQFFHIGASDGARFTVGWQTPGSASVSVIGRQSFGACFGGQVGPLQLRDKPINADFDSKYVGLVPVGVDNAFAYHFHCPVHGVSRTVYHWDLGDGQSATGPDVDHIYFAPAVMPVKLTINIGDNTTSETRRLVVGPDYQHPINPPMVDDKTAAAQVAGYDPNTLLTDSAAPAAKLLLAANLLDKSAAFAAKSLRAKHHADGHATLEEVSLVSDALMAAGRIADARQMWSAAPADGDVQPRAGKRAAQLALWSEGDFDTAVMLLRPLIDRKDPSVTRMAAQSLLLAGKVDEARAIFAKLPRQDSAEHEAVLSGAFTRNIDFYVRKNEPDAGDEAWDRWQAKYPATFLDGYAAVLKAQLISLHGQPAVGAKVAEAFASAVPNSSYAPRLLDMASKWLAPIDRDRSNLLRDRLRKNYPEDPLAQ